VKNLVYVSYIDKPSKIDLVEYNFNKIKSFFDNIVFVYSSYNEKPLSRNFCGLSDENLIFAPNDGYDFGKYKLGIQKFLDSPMSYTTIFNDSVSIVGSLDSIMLFIEERFSEGHEYVGFLKSEEIRDHFQSWFINFSKNALIYFYKNISKPISDKQEVINKYEVELSNRMIYHFRSSFYWRSNANLFYYQHIIDKVIQNENTFPFLKNNSFKKEFTKNPHNMDLNKMMKLCSSQLSNKFLQYINA
tara:strand:- start:2940 stop:3674 length:735 start_codon:yes stop_codon:yes gene_type:complete